MNTDTQRIIIIIGMSGSGKTTLGKKMTRAANMFGRWHYVDNVFVGHRVLEFHALLQRGESICVSDIQFCNADTLNLFIAGLPSRLQKTMQLEYFENNPEQCRLNCWRRSADRGDKNSDTLKRELEWIDRLTLSYNPVNPRPVYAPKK